MKTILAILSLVVIIGCKGGGSGSTAGNDNPSGPNLDPSCKEINELWSSTTDMEVHDLGLLTLDQLPDSAYEWISGTGTVCQHTGELRTATHPDLVANEFHYVIEFHHNLPAGGCEIYQDGNIIDDHGSAVIRLECNKLTMCRTAFDMSECKEFN